MLGDILLRDIQVGTPWTGVIAVHAGECTAVWHGEALLLEGIELGDGRHTLYNFIYSGLRGGVPILTLHSDSQAFQARPTVTRSFRTLVDLCSGLGGMSQGPKGLSGHTSVYVDHSPLAVATVRDNGGNAILGDVTDPAVQLAIHQQEAQCACSSTITAGIPCQPYSKQGLQLGTADARSTVLEGVLLIGWRLQAAGIVLECVSEIAGHADVQLFIREFARTAGYVFHSVELELGHVWVSRRRRWWACLVPPTAKPLVLLPYPEDLPRLTVKDIVPEWPCWSDAEEQELAWSEVESRMMQDPAYGQDPRVLNCNAQAPTALHSWGNALRPCPCGCRAAGFTHQRLQSGGLRGVGIVSGLLGVLRFLHPCEAAFLNSLSPAFRFCRGARAGLCLVGNLSAPLQAHWIFATLQHWHASHAADEQPLDPVIALQSFKNGLVHARQDFWPVPSLRLGACTKLQCTTQLELPAAGGPWTAGHIMQAVRQIVGPGHSVQMYDGARLLSPRAFLHPGSAPSTICIKPKRSAKPDLQPSLQATAPCCQVALLLPASTKVHACPLGSSVAMLLDKLALPIGYARIIGPSTAFDICAPLAGDAVVDLRPPLAHPLATGVVSDAAMHSALTKLVEHLPPEATCLPSSLVAALAGLSVDEAQSFGGFQGALQPFSRLLLPIVADGHWACICVQIQQDCLTALYLDGVPGRLSKLAAHICGILGALLGHGQVTLLSQTWFLQGPNDSCGTVMLRHLCACVAGPGPQVEHILGVLLQGEVPLGRAHGAGDLSSEQEQALKSLLLAKGVPEPNLDARVQAAVKKLGAGPVAQALAHKKAGAQLKAIASKPGNMFRWIPADELAQHIEFKADAKFGTSIQKGKTKKSRQTPARQPTQLQVDPAKLLLAPGSFVDADGTALSQLAFHEIGAQSSGIAFCSATQAAPFLASGKSLSVDSLALVCVSELAPEQHGLANVSAIHFPAVYGPTGEAVLIRGSLVQLGDEPVQLQQSQIADSDQLETATCRFTVFRDETSLDWDAFIAAPVRELVSGNPGLTLCKEASCNQQCGRFHASVEEAGCIDRLLLDLWGRQWLKADGGRVAPAEAQVFACLVRVPASALKHLHQLLIRGFYSEPRAPGGTAPHAGFAVIWLPDTDYPHALHILRTCPQAVALTRLGRRYGIRCRESDEPSVFQALRPGCDFQRVKISAHFRLHPLPFGCQRKHLQGLLKSWAWNARPLQPARGDGEGAAWIVGASEDPPGPAIPCGGAFVLVQKIRDTAIAAPPASITASGRTKRQILYDDGDEAVQGANSDPWSGGPLQGLRPGFQHLRLHPMHRHRPSSLRFGRSSLRECKILSSNTSVRRMAIRPRRLKKPIPGCAASRLVSKSCKHRIRSSRAGSRVSANRCLSPTARLRRCKRQCRPSQVT